MENLHSYRCTAEQNRLYLPYYHDLRSLWRKGTVPPMKGRMKPYLPELTIRDYNIYLQYLRGVAAAAVHRVWVVFLPSAAVQWRGVCYFVRQPCRAHSHLPASASAGHPVLAQDDVPDAGHPAGGTGGSAAGLAQPADRRPDELRPAKRLRRALDRVLLRRAYERAVQQNPALERLFGQERDQAVVQMNLNAKNYNLAAEPMSNVYGALYSIPRHR